MALFKCNFGSISNVYEMVVILSKKIMIFRDTGAFEDTSWGLLDQDMKHCE